MATGALLGRLIFVRARKVDDLIVFNNKKFMDYVNAWFPLDCNEIVKPCYPSKF